MGEVRGTQWPRAQALGLAHTMTVSKNDPVFNSRNFGLTRDGDFTPEVRGLLSWPTPPIQDMDFRGPSCEVSVLGEAG